MGPARFHCATLLLIGKSLVNTTFFRLSCVHFTLNIRIFRVSSVYIYNPFQKEKKLKSFPINSVLLSMESLEILSIYAILTKRKVVSRARF